MRPHGSPEQLEQRRRRALELLKHGWTLSAVAQRVGCSVGAVHLWRETYRKRGAAGLRAKPVPGRPPKLRSHQQRALTRLLLKGAVACGFSTELWTQRRVGQVIHQQFGVRYHPHHLWRFLTSLGWSCQKPERRARERNEEAIAHWKRYVWPHIKKGQRAWGPAGVSRRERLPARP